MSQPTIHLRATRGIASAFATLMLLLVLPAAAQAQPKAKSDNLIHDFGVVPRGNVTDHTFELRNEGDADLVVNQVRSSCACTVVDYPKVIAPGETGQFKVDLDTMLLAGPSTKRVQVYSNDPENPRIDLTVKVDSRPYVDVVPGYFRYIVVQGFEDAGSINQLVLASSPKNFSVTKVETPADFIDLSFREAEPAERNKDHDGPQWIVSGKIRPDAPVGPLTGYVDIYTDHEKQKKASIPLSGFVRPVFAVTPSEADFGDLQLEEPRKTALDVRSFATEKINITSVENSVPGIDTSVEVQDDGRRFWLKMTVPTDLPKGTFSGAVTLTTDSERVPTIVVPIRGNVQ